MLIPEPISTVVGTTRCYTIRQHLGSVPRLFLTFLQTHSLAWLIALIFLFTSSATSWANLVGNGDFKAGLANWSTIFGTVETAVTGDGAYALVLIGTPEGSGVAQQITGLVPGQTYQVKARMRVAAGQHPVYLVVNGQRVWTHSAEQRQVTFEYTLGATESNLLLWVWFDGRDPAERAEVMSVDVNPIKPLPASVVVTGEKVGERIPEYWQAGASPLEGDPRQWFGPERVAFMQIGFGRELLGNTYGGPGRVLVVKTPTGRYQIIYLGVGSTVTTDINAIGLNRAKARRITYSNLGARQVVETIDVTNGRYQISVGAAEVAVVELFPVAERVFRIPKPAEKVAMVGNASSIMPVYHTAVWYPTWAGERALTALRTHGDLIDEVNFFWFDMQAGGGIALKGNGEDTEALALAWQAGCLVIPTVTNGFNATLTHSVLAPVEVRQRHINNLVDLVVRNGYDGLDLDYESMSASDRDLFSTFIEEVAAALHAYGKILSVTVHPKTSEPGPYAGPQSQDYTRIGKAADIVKLMIYDYSYSGGKAGPVSPINWADQVLAFAGKAIPPQKVMYGLPWYGYDWPGGNVKASSVDVIRAKQLVQTTGALVKRDSNQEPFFTYQDATGKQHTVYFQDGQSYAARLQMLQMKHPELLGVAHWQIGNEAPEFWTALESLRRPK